MKEILMVYLLSLSCFIIIIGVTLLILLNNLWFEPFVVNEPVKYAVCVWGELRGVKTTHANFNTFLVDPLHADVFVFAQNNYNKEDNNSLIQYKVVYKRMYDKPSIPEYFANSDGKNKLDEYYDLEDNWKIYSNIQQYINFNEISKEIGDQLQDNYDYVIMIRSDFLFLFDFPDILNMSLSNLPELFWCYRGHEYGGLNYTMISVPTKHIKAYLSSPYQYIMNGKIREMFNGGNCEMYLQSILNSNSWIVGYIQMNAFISGDSLDEHTTFASMKYSENHDVVYKYEEQLTNSFEAFELWNSGKRWVLHGNALILG